MVKVQKPAPKTLKKAANLEVPMKKKSKEKNSSALKKVPAQQLLKQAKNKIDGKKPAKLEKIIKNKATEKPKKTKKEKAVAPKLPLVLAPPPDSPKPTKPSSAKTDKKQSKKNKQNEVMKTPTPAPSLVPKKNKKKKGSNKKDKKASKAEVNANAKDANSNKTKEDSAPLNKMQKKKLAMRAFQKQQAKQKRTGTKKQKKPVPKMFEPVSFDEDKFNAIVNVDNIKKIAKGLKQQVEQEVAAKKTSIFSDYHYFLNVSCFKIPSCPKRMVKLNLKHSLVDPENDDVVIIVPDLQRGAKVDYDPTIQHYDDLFREAGVQGLKIMPFNQLRKECNTFETKRKLGNTYDYFMCDGRIVGRVAGFCGKVFQKPRTTFHAVRLENTKNLKNEIEKSLRRTAYKQLHKGDLISILVGNDKYTSKQLAENVEHVIAQLKTIYPGGLGNIRSMNLKIDITGTSSLPVYVSMAQPSAETPFIVGKREERMLKLKKEANEILSKFTLTKDADIIKLNKDQVKRKRQLKEARAELLAESKKSLEVKVDDGDEIVPAKKSRKEKNTVKLDKKKEEKLDEEPTDDDEENDNENEQDDDEDDDDSGDEEESD